MGYLIDYFFLISISGFIIFSIFTIMAFMGIESFKIEKGNENQAAIISGSAGVVIYFIYL